MTAPQQPPPEEQESILPILAALIALLLAAGAVASIIGALLRLQRMEHEALWYLVRNAASGTFWRGQVFRMADERGKPGTGAWSTPQTRQWDENVRRRAAYLINAGRRVSRGFRDGKLVDSVEAEMRYARQHLEAQRLRTDRAADVAMAWETYGPGLLGWHAVMDERTSAECRVANGRNFDPARIPPIGYPGTVHPHCRCRAGFAFATLRRVESIRPDYRRSAA